MSVHDYWMQNLINQQSQPVQPTVSQAPTMEQSPTVMQAPAPSPLILGSQSAAQAANQSRAGKESFFSNVMDTLGKTLSNISIGQLRGSPVPSARRVGHMMKTIEEQEEHERRREREDMQATLNQMKILSYISRQQDLANRAGLQETRQSSNLAETVRHHKEMERLRGGDSQYSKKADLNAHRERILDERIRHNKEMERLRGMGPLGGNAKLTGKLKDRVASIDSAKRELDAISSTFNQLQKETEKNFFSPFAAVPGANAAKQLLAERGGKGFLKIKKENVLRNRLVSQFSRIEPTLELVAKGSAPGEQLLKRFHQNKVYFDISQPPEVIQDRLADLRNDLENTRKSILGGQSDISPASEGKRAFTMEDVSREARKRLESGEQPDLSPEIFEEAEKRMTSE